MPYFCYLLKSQSHNSAKCYIGFTTNPRRRLRQHNGELTAGAYRTKKYRPWEHVAIISGIIILYIFHLIFIINFNIYYLYYILSYNYYNKY
jgi:hypothetical protein